MVSISGCRDWVSSQHSGQASSTTRAVLPWLWASAMFLPMLTVSASQSLSMEGFRHPRHLHTQKNSDAEVFIWCQELVCRQTLHHMHFRTQQKPNCPSSAVSKGLAGARNGGVGTILDSELPGLAVSSKGYRMLPHRPQPSRLQSNQTRRPPRHCPSAPKSPSSESESQAPKGRGDCTFQVKNDHEPRTGDANRTAMSSLPRQSLPRKGTSHMDLCNF